MPDKIDKEVYTETFQVREMYYKACKNLGLKPSKLSPIVIGMRSVREEDD